MKLEVRKPSIVATRRKSSYFRTTLEIDCIDLVIDFSSKVCEIKKWVFRLIYTSGNGIDELIRKSVCK